MKLRSPTLYLLALVIGSLLVSSVEVLSYWRDVEPSSPIVAAWPVIFLVLLAGKVASKVFGLYPFISAFREDAKERWYYTLLMSTGLTFGTISALYGLSHKLVTKEQYSFLVAAVIASAVVPTIIASIYFVPSHLLVQTDDRIRPRRLNGLSDEG